MDARGLRGARAGCWLLLCACALSGCGMVSQRRLDDSKVRIQALQAENEQLRDVVLNVRSQNKNMASRALDDERRLRALEEANGRLERSVLAYQDESKQVAALLDQLRTQVRVASTGGPRASLIERLEDVVARERELRFDASKQTVWLPADRLFDRATGDLTPEAARWLEALAGVARTESSGARLAVELSGPGSGSGLALASAEDNEGARARWRLEKLRSRMESASGLGPDVITTRSEGADGDGVVAAGGTDGVTIRFRAVAR